MSDPDKVITLVSLLEHDYSDHNAVVTVSRALLDRKSTRLNSSH